MNDLQVLTHEQFGNVRMLNENGKVLFCGADVAKALGYSKPQNAISAHCRGALKRGMGVQTGTKADGTPAMQNIEMLFIPEPDLYRLIINSKLPSAEQFEKWVMEEVLPSIRQHGAYMTEQKIEDILADPDTIIQLATQLKKFRTENAMQKQIIGELKPKANYVDVILKNKSLVTITQIAKDYGMSGTELNKLLHEWGVQYKESGQWLLYKKYQSCGYTQSETIDIKRSTGLDVKMNTKWTQKGRLFLHELLTKNGYLPNIDKL